MAGYEQEFILTGGMNQDLEDRLLPPENWRYAFCIRSGSNEKDAVGSIENIQGNELISIALPAGNNRVIGTYADDRGSIFYFMYNSNGFHSIYRYKVSQNSFDVIIGPSQLFPSFPSQWLNFQNSPSYRILTVDLVLLPNGQELLTWTDGYDNDISIPYDNTVPPANQFLKAYNPPRSINVTLATNSSILGAQPRYDAAFGVQNPAVQNQFTDMIKYPPYDAPAVEFRGDITRQTNYFRGKALPQFRYRYVYLGGEVSAWSTISKCALPEEDETIFGIATFNSYKNNFVRITYNTGHSTVVKIELAVRFGNTGTWKLFDGIEKFEQETLNTQYPFNRLLPDNTGQTYDFYNDKVVRTIADLELYTQSDVPIVARHQEILQNNRLAYANIIEGYDSVTLDVVSIPFIQSADVGKSVYSGQPLWTNDGWYNLTNAFTDAAPRNNLLLPKLYTNVFANTSVIITFQAVSSGDIIQDSIVIPASAVVSQAAWDNYVSTTFYNFIANGFAALVGAPVPLDPLTTTIQGGFEYYVIKAAGVIVNLVFGTLNVVGTLAKIPGFKLGAWHKFAVIYEDDGGRNGLANSVENLDVYVPFYTEQGSGIQGLPYDTSDYDSGWKADITLNIRNLAPKWAKTYRIAYGGSNISKFVQLPITGTPTLQSNGVLRINVDSLLSFFVNDNKPTPINYVYEAGDRVRFMTNTDGDILSNYVDLAIKDLVTAGSNFFIEVDNFDFATNKIGEGAYIELYRTREFNDQNEIVYEFGESYEVLYNQASNRWYHQGGEGFPDQDPNNPVTSPAQVFLGRGDVYVRRRGYKFVVGNAPTAISGVEDFNFSDFYPSADIDIGRPNVIVDNAYQKVLETGLRHGESIFQSNSINGISTFLSLGDELVVLPLNFGSISMIKEVGLTLKVVQASKVISIYIQRLQTQLADGSNNLVATNKIFATQLIPDEEPGSTFPGSVTVHGRSMYFVDAFRGEVVRDSPNGQIPISKYGEVQNFRNLLKLVGNYQNTRPNDIEIISYFDENLDGYLFTILVLSPEITDLRSQTWFFHEDSNQWKAEMPWTPEMYVERGPNNVFSFVDGQIYRHYSDNVPYNNFYGVQYRSKIRLIHNSDPNKVKVFDTITVNSNRKWEATGENGDELNIIVPANDQYPTGMASRIVSTKFKPREGQWVAEFIKDANSPGFTDPDRALINGRSLRGYICDVTLEIDSTEYVRMFSVIIKSTPSQLSK